MVAVVADEHIDTEAAVVLVSLDLVGSENQRLVDNLDAFDKYLNILKQKLPFEFYSEFSSKLKRILNVAFAVPFVFDPRLRKQLFLLFQNRTQPSTH